MNWKVHPPLLFSRGIYAVTLVCCLNVYKANKAICSWTFVWRKAFTLQITSWVGFSSLCFLKNISNLPGLSYLLVYRGFDNIPLISLAMFVGSVVMSFFDSWYWQFGL